MSLGMANLTLDLFVNMTERGLVRAADDASPFTLPSRLFVVGDKIPVRLMLLLRNSYRANQPPFTQITPSGYAVKVGIGAAGSTTTTEATAMTISGNFMLLTLDLTTTEFATAVTAGTALTFYIKISEDGLSYQTVYVASIQGQANTTSVSTTPAAGATYLTADEVAALFCKKIMGAGETLTLTSPDGTKQGIASVANDGSTHFDPI